MGKLFALLVGVVLISHQLHCCVAFDIIGMASSVVGLGQSVYDIMSKLLSTDRSVDKVLISIQNLNQDIQHDMTLIGDTLKDLPSIIRLELKKETLEGHFAIIGQVFEEASRLKKNVDKGNINTNNTVYQRFAVKEEAIDHSIYEIRRILTDVKTAFVLKQNFTQDLKKFENVCKTGMSHLQLLDALLGNLKVATAQYYLTKKFMYEFLELTGEDNSDAKQTLLENVNLDYSDAVKKFKDIMRDASVELWKCDPAGGYNDTTRYTNNTDPNYAELRIFSKYIVNENNFAGKGGFCSQTKCDTITKIDQCDMWDRQLCSKVRSCPGRLIGCKQYTYDHYSSYRKADVCRNNDKTAYHRYQSIVTYDEPAENFHCDKSGNKATITSSLFQVPLGASYSCDYCGCLCEEQDYYVDDTLVLADIDSNKIITGARLLVQNNTLRLQIQEATLVANGTIDKSTVEWQPLKPIYIRIRRKISFDEFRKFDLTPVIKPSNHVVTGMSLVTDSQRKTIYLNVATVEFNFRSGLLKYRKSVYSDIKYNRGAIPTQKYDISERDASTKSKKENKPDSTDDQYVELTVTDLAKDGGQSVVPFIDTQNVTSKGPLSGASLYVRGQPGFGGFLGIKLYTLDIRSYVDDQNGL